MSGACLSASAHKLVLNFVLFCDVIYADHDCSAFCGYILVSYLTSSVSIDHRRSVATNLLRASIVAWVLQSTVARNISYRGYVVYRDSASARRVQISACQDGGELSGVY